MNKREDRAVGEIYDRLTKQLTLCAGNRDLAHAALEEAILGAFVLGREEGERPKIPVGVPVPVPMPQVNGFLCNCSCGSRNHWFTAVDVHVPYHVMLRQMHPAREAASLPRTWVICAGCGAEWVKRGNTHYRIAAPSITEGQ